MKAPTRRPACRRWQAAVSMFTILPAGRAADVGPGEAAAIMMWLPAVGGLLAIPAAGILLAVEDGGGAPRKLLGATLAIAALGLLTGGLHLDGLADTADGLGSRRPPGEALEIMRRSDTGPMGVAALVLTLLVQATALAAISPPWLGAAALVAAAITGRVAVVLASGSAPARPDGFGALMTGVTRRAARWGAAAALLGLIGSAAAVGGGVPLAGRGLAAVLAGLGAAALLRLIAMRRLGGMTGDVFGAMIEIGTATVLAVVAVLP